MRTRGLVIALAAIVLIGVAVLTLGPQPFGARGWLTFVLDDIRDLDPGAWRTVRGPGEFAANLLLFVPVGVVLVLLLGLRRWWLALLICVAATIGIEVAQESLPNRFADISDVIANSIGGFLGVALGAVVSRRRRAARDRRARATDRAPDARPE